MTSNDVTTEPRLPARGSIDALRTAVVYTTTNGPLETFGCPACCSGLDPRLSDELQNAAG
jgi:hypothetical protein